MRVWSLGQEVPLESEMSTHSSILSWKIPWTREVWQATVHGVAKSWTWLIIYIQTWHCARHCGQRRRWHPTPVLLPGKSYGWRSLVGCSPWGRWGSDTTERLDFHFSRSCVGEGNGSSLQCSCLENARDGGLPSVGSHRVGHNWRDLAAAAGIVGGRALDSFLPETKRQRQKLGWRWFSSSSDTGGKNSSVCKITLSLLFLKIMESKDLRI